MKNDRLEIELGCMALGALLASFVMEQSAMKLVLIFILGMYIAGKSARQ